MSNRLFVCFMCVLVSGCSFLGEEVKVGYQSENLASIIGMRQFITTFRANDGDYEASLEDYEYVYGVSLNDYPFYEYEQSEASFHWMYFGGLYNIEGFKPSRKILIAAPYPYIIDGRYYRHYLYCDGVIKIEEEIIYSEFVSYVVSFLEYGSFKD